MVGVANRAANESHDSLQEQRSKCSRRPDDVQLRFGNGRECTFSQADLNGGAGEQRSLSARASAASRARTAKP